MAPELELTPKSKGIFTRACAYIGNVASGPAKLKINTKQMHLEQQIGNFTRLPTRTSSREKRIAYVCSCKEKEEKKAAAVETADESVHGETGVEGSKDMAASVEMADENVHGEAEVEGSKDKTVYLGEGWEFGNMICVVKEKYFEYRVADPDEVLQEDRGVGGYGPCY